ncbi:MAG: endonuclease/exonuclease/phosphatase family protein [Bacteroidota bacterium]
MRLLLLLFSLCFVVVLHSQSSEIILDGKFNDWTNKSTISREPFNASSIPQLTNLSVHNDESFLYIRFTLDREIFPQRDNFLELYIDTDDNAATGQSIEDMGAELYYHFGQRFGLFNADTLRPADIGTTILPTHTNDEFELRIFRFAFPDQINPLLAGNPIKILLRGGSTSNNQLPEQGSLNYQFLEGPFTPFEPVSVEQPMTNSFRLASYNILRDRPLDPSFTPGFQRIVRAIDADVFCFQEFFDSSATQVKNLMDETLDLGTDDGWYVTKEDFSTVTASKYPIIQTLRINNFANITASWIDLPSSFPNDVVVINAHTTCCNFESERQFQVDAIAAFINELKARNGRMIVPQNTPIIVAGDLNLVGFKQQLETILQGEIINVATFGTGGLPDWDDTPMEDLAPTLTHEPASFTWRSGGSSFTPGKLDYIIYSDSELKAENGFVFEPFFIPEDLLNSLNLTSSDAFFSDHLPVVGDFSMSPITNTQELSFENKINIFPNPATTEINISSKNTGIGMASIYQSNGQLIKSYPINLNQDKMDISNLSAGNYWVRVNNNEHVEWFKIIKQ